MFPAGFGERPAKRLSYHTDFTANPYDPQFRNQVSGRGPVEGRPPGEIFAHQRWDEFFPKVGYVMTWGPVAPNSASIRTSRRRIRIRFEPTAPAGSWRAPCRRS